MMASLMTGQNEEENYSAKETVVSSLALSNICHGLQRWKFLPDFVPFDDVDLSVEYPRDLLNKLLKALQRIMTALRV